MARPRKHRHGATSRCTRLGTFTATPGRGAFRVAGWDAEGMAGDVVPRDDRAWPRSSLPVSVVLIVVAVGAGVGLVVGAAGRDVVGMVVVGGGFVVAFAFGVVVAVKGMRPWIAGHPVPGPIRLLEWGAVVVGFVILGLVDVGLGWAIIAGLMGGVLSANVWGIRIARANRGAVDQAVSAR